MHSIPRCRPRRAIPHNEGDVRHTETIGAPAIKAQLRHLDRKINHATRARNRFSGADRWGQTRRQLGQHDRQQLAVLALLGLEQAVLVEVARGKHLVGVDVVLARDQGN